MANRTTGSICKGYKEDPQYNIINGPNTPPFKPLGGGYVVAGFTISLGKEELYGTQLSWRTRTSRDIARLYCMIVIY